MLELISDIWPNVANALSEGETGFCWSRKPPWGARDSGKKGSVGLEGRGAVREPEEAGALLSGKGLKKEAGRHVGDEARPGELGCGWR